MFGFLEKRKNRMLNWRKGEVIIFSFFILLTLVITYPLIFKMDRSIFSDPEWTFDSLGCLYGIWWAKYAWLNKFSSTFNHLVAFPFGVDSSQAPTQPGLSCPLLVLSLWQNEFFAYNFFILASFVLSAVIVYYLVYYLTKDKLASMFSGLVFAFCPNHSLQSFSHIGLAAIQWMPLYVLSLLMLNEERCYRNAIFLAFTFSLVTLSAYYYGYFMVIFTVGFILFKMAYGKWDKNYQVMKSEKLKTFKVIILAGVLALVMILPSSYNMIKNKILPQKPVCVQRTGRLEAVVTIKYKQPLSDLYRYAARGYDYLLPSEYHPIFGKLTQKIVKTISDGRRHWSERTLYLGLTPLFLAVMGVIGWKKRRKLKVGELKENFYILLFLFSAALAFYFSLPPLIGFGKIKIFTPSFFLYRLAPMFRVYARMGFVVTLCVAVLAGFGLRDILANIKRKWNQMAIALAFSFLILFEYTVVPPFRNVDFGKTPAVYEWLAKEPEDIVIAEYPLYDFINEKHYEYLFYQRVHQKKMVNGAPRGSKGDKIRELVMDILKPESRSVLKDLGVDYLIIHKESYEQRDWASLDNSQDLEFTKDFPSARVYRIRS